MNKYTIISLLTIATMATACNKQGQQHEVICEPIEVLTYGYGSSLRYNMKPTDSRNCLMTFYNDHSYPVNFKISFPEMPAGMEAIIQKNNFSLTETRDYLNYIILTTNNTAPGFYEVPVVVSTDKGGQMGTTLLQITVSDISTTLEAQEPAVSYVSK